MWGDLSVLHQNMREKSLVWRDEWELELVVAGGGL